MDTALVHLDVSGGIATITLDSPANRNALSSRLVDDLEAALEGAAAGVEDGSVRAIVVTHVPPAFCAGADLKERRDGPPDSTPVVRCFQRLMDVEVPTIAAVKGPARAGGLGLVASCDLAVVHRDVTFALTEVHIGVAIAIISVPILRRVPASKLAAPALTGATFDAEAAREMGLITHVSDDVDATVTELCDAIRLGAPRAIAETKRILREVPGRDRDEAFDEMRRLSEHLFRSDDAREGMTAFAEKRRPRWHLEA